MKTKLTKHNNSKQDYELIGDLKMDQSCYDWESIKFTEQNYKIIEILHVTDGVHPAFGRVTVTSGNLENMVQNFHDNVRGVDLAIDFDHDAGEAAGWIEDIWLSEDKNSLWAAIKFTPAGARKLDEKLYRYFSPEFTLNYVDNQGQQFGATLVGGGLTNRPYLKDLPALVTMNEKQIKSKGKTDMSLEIENKKLKEEVAKLKSDATSSKINTQLSEEKDKNISMSDELKVEKAKSAKLANTIDIAEKTRKFDEYSKQGKVLPAHKDVFMKLPLKDAIAFAEANEVQINLSAQGSGENEGDKDNVKFTAEDKECCKKLGLSKEDYIKYNGDDYRKLD